MNDDTFQKIWLQRQPWFISRFGPRWKYTSLIRIITKLTIWKQMEYILRKNTFAEKGLYGKIFFCLVGKRGGDGGEGRETLTNQLQNSTRKLEQ